jgi:hypothetical protein
VRVLHGGPAAGVQPKVEVARASRPPARARRCRDQDARGPDRTTGKGDRRRCAVPSRCCSREAEKISHEGCSRPRRIRTCPPAARRAVDLRHSSSSNLRCSAHTRRACTCIGIGIRGRSPRSGDGCNRGDLCPVGATTHGVHSGPLVERGESVHSCTDECSDCITHCCSVSDAETCSSSCAAPATGCHSTSGSRSISASDARSTSICRDVETSAGTCREACAFSVPTDSSHATNDHDHLQRLAASTSSGRFSPASRSFSRSILDVCERISRSNGHR